MNDDPISDRDEEILRMLYATQFDNKKAKLMFTNKVKY